jgi:WD40 repeat protein/serine/threonine protein kinase
MSRLSPREDRLEEVVLEYLKAVDAGEAPEPRDVIARHPDLASDLREYFEVDLAVMSAVRNSPAAPIPIHLSNYEVLEELGHGGMGIVYKARQKSLGRVVALKTVRNLGLEDEVTRQRFATEVANVARLDHPHIVPLYELGEEQGQLYFSMKWIDGPSLALALHQRRKPLPTNSAARLLVVLARAVHHAHQRGILHRDLKPANILLQRKSKIHNPKSEPLGEVAHLDFDSQDPDFVPYVSDFGLASPVETSAQLSRAGAISGTPFYMAPEQASAQADLTTAVDVYGLGVILYECLTLNRPFNGPNLCDVLEKVRNESPIPPRVLNPRLDHDLEAICLKCLEKDPGKRYGSADQLAADLEHWLNNEPVLARPSNQWERLRKWARRRPAVAGLLALLLLIMPLGIAGITWQAIEKGRALSRTEVQIYFNQIKLAQLNIDSRQHVGADETLNLCAEKLRHFEWHYLKRLCKLEHFELKGCNGTILTAAYSPDGKLLATASQDGTLTVWETGTGKQVRQWLSGSRILAGLCFTGDGRFLISTSQDRGLTLWNYQTAQQLYHDPDSSGGVACGGSIVAAILPQKETVRVWVPVTVKDAVRLELLETIPIESKMLNSIALSRDGFHLAVGGWNRLVKVWSIKNAKLELRKGFNYDLNLGVHHIRALAFSADGKLLATGSDQTAIWEVSTGLLVRSFNGAADLTCSSISFSAPGSGLLGSKSGTLLAATFQDGQVRIWDTDKGRVLMPPRRQERPIRAIVFSPADEGMLAMLRDNAITIVNVSPGAAKDPSIVLKQPPGKRHFQAVAFSPDGSRLAARARELTNDPEDNHLLLWSVDKLSNESGTQLDAAREPRRANLAFSPDSQLLVAGSSTKAVSVWNSSGVAGTRGSIPTEAARLVAFSKRGLMATCGGFNADRLKLWNLNKDQEMPLIDGFTGEVFALAFSPDGGRLAIAGTKVRVDEAATGKMLYELEGLKYSTTCVAFSQDGQLLVTGGTDLSLRLWDALDGRPLGVLKGHASPVESVAVSPDGRRIASCSLDGSVKLWDVAAQQEVLTLAGHDASATGVAFSPDGLRLASCGEDGCVRIWDASPTGDDS